MPNVLLNVADTGPLESLAAMFERAGYTCFLPSASLKAELRALGCDNVLDIDSLIRGMGYEMPRRLPEASSPDGMLLVDTKAHRNAGRIWSKWPQQKLLWYRINGGLPEHVSGCGDEVNPPCPVVTPNQWYKERIWCKVCGWRKPRGLMLFTGRCPKCSSAKWEHAKWNAYVFWPRYERMSLHERRHPNPSDPPICLIHNVNGWGYRDLVEPLRHKFGLRVYGRGSPDGLITAAEARKKLQTAIAMVHLKSNDAPGYALLEAMAAGCPIVCPRRLLWRCRMHEMFGRAATLNFDRETHDPLSETDVLECVREIGEHLKTLTDPEVNSAYGINGRSRLISTMWTDVDGFRAFLEGM